MSDVFVHNYLLNNNYGPTTVLVGSLLNQVKYFTNSYLNITFLVFSKLLPTFVLF